MTKNDLKTHFLPQWALAVALTVTIAWPAWAVTYHVDPNTGCDNNSGTKNLPFKTLSKAQEKAAFGDTIILADGRYSDFTAEPETRYPNKSDKIEPNDPRWITFKAAEDAKPKISHIVFVQDKGPALLAYRLSGIKVAGGGVVLRGIVGFEMENCEIVGVGDKIEQAKGGYVSIRSCGSVTFNNCKIHYRRTVSISISSSSHVTINGCEIYDVGVDHITLRTEFDDCYQIHITNNIIRNTQRWNPKAHCDAIQFYADKGHRFYSCRVTGNIIRDMAVQGLFIHAGSGRFIDGLVENNLIYNCGSRSLILSKTTDTICRNNTVVGTSSFSEKNSRLAVYNNLFTGPYVTKDPASLGYHDYNIYVRDWKDRLRNTEPHSFGYPKGYKAKMKDRLFVNAREADFRLKQGCRAIDFCPKEPSAAVDITGHPRDDKPDPGCYEFIPDVAPTTQDPNSV